MTVIRARSALPRSLLVVLLVAMAGCATPSGSPIGESLLVSPGPTASADETASPEATPSEQAVAEAEVVIVEARFAPAELTVAAGTEVVFVNEDGYGHTVTEGTDGQVVDDAFVDEELPANSSIRVVFDEPGSFDITCIIHPTMQMTITVED